MNGWIIGYIVGGVVVVVVVTVLLLMIVGIRRTAEKAEAIVAALHEARDGTAGLWLVADTSHTAGTITTAAMAARRGLTPGGARP